jgi:hypothetical protein
MKELTPHKIYLPHALGQSLLKQGAAVERDDTGYYITGWIQGYQPQESPGCYYNPCKKYLCWWQPGCSEPVGMEIYHNQIKEVQ